MKTAFDPIKKQWAGSALDILPKHDLFFGTPVNSPFAGLPLGDGDIGSLLWLEKDGLHVHINKCDLWEDAPAGVTEDDEIYCSGREEQLTCLKHGGELTVKFDCPIFDVLYQRDFFARLRLTDATAVISAETPFGVLHAEAFADAETGVSVLKCGFEAPEPCAPEIRLFRWGSRTLWRWYGQQKFAPEIGLDGTQAFAAGKSLFISQKLNTGFFCLGVAVESAAASDGCRVNCHICHMTLKGAKRQNFTVYYTVTLGGTAAQAEASCRARLRNAVKIGAAAMHESHRVAWARFWERSFVSIPDDYIENVWYLWLYCMNSESRGKYPPLFTVGLWSFRNDYVPWACYFHYNMQHMYAPLDAAGHGELAENYYAMRRAGLERAYLYASRAKGRAGAFYHDVSDRYGRFANYDSLNCTPGAQIAMQMYRHWRYTGDRKFLEKTALPVMKGAAEFYLDLLKKGEDGLYHIYGTTAYEGNRPTDDTLTDLVMVRALFAAYSEFADEGMKERMRDVLSALPEPICVPLSREDWDGDFFTRGIGKGLRPYGDGMVLAVGLREGKPVRIMKKEPEYGFPDIELCPLYPAGIFGLKDKNTPLFDVMRNQILVGGRMDMEWSMYPIYLARMGMARETADAVREMLGRFQRYPNGMGVETGMYPAIDTPRWNTVRDTDSGAVGRVDPREYAHFDFETAPIVAKSVAESLLQSHEGVLRLCPAIRDEDCVSFSLYAEGGFRVTAEASPGGLAATVESLRGENCFVVLPERFDLKKLYLYRICDGAATAITPKQTRVRADFALDLSDLKAGETALISTVPAQALEFAPRRPTEPNSGMKECGDACLGSPCLVK